MTSESMGSFGAYKYAYDRYGDERDKRENRSFSGKIKEGAPAEVTWVTKRYIPTDLRSTAPVPTKKIMNTGLPQIPSHWRIAQDPPLRSFERTDDRIYSFHPSTRCQEWSTLRQMLPSRGSVFRLDPPCWGTGHGSPAVPMVNHPRRFPIINSPMSRYVEAMQATDSLFRLY